MSDSSTVELFRELFSPPGPTWGPLNKPLMASESEIPPDLLDMNGEGWGRSPKYELRYREIRRSLGGISGHMYPAQLARLMEYLLSLRVDDLQAEQPHVEWRLIGVLVVESHITKSSAVASNSVGGSAELSRSQARFATSMSWDEEVSAGSKVPLVKPPVASQQQRDAQVVLQLAFACLDPQVELVPPEARHQGIALQGVETPMAAYIKSGRKLSKLPTALVQERESAARVRRQLDELERSAGEVDLKAAQARLARVSPAEMNALVSTLGYDRAALALGVSVAALQALATPHSQPPAESKPRSKGVAKEE